MKSGLHGDIFYKASSAQSDRTPLLLLMGYSGTVDSWTDEFLSAIDAKWPVIACDLPGNGRATKKITEDRLTYNVMADDIAGLLRHLGHDQAHVLGYSYGGTIALSTARARPDLVKSLILTATTLGGKNYVSPPKALLAALANPSGDSLEEKTESIWRVCIGADKVETFRPVMNRILEKQRDSLTPGWVLRKQLGNYMSFDFGAEAAVLQVPVTVLTGDEDPLTPPANSELIARHISGATLIKLEGCRHMPHVEQPEVFAKEIIAHLHRAE